MDETWQNVLFLDIIRESQPNLFNYFEMDFLHPQYPELTRFVSLNEI